LNIKARTQELKKEKTEKGRQPGEKKGKEMDELIAE